MLVVVDHSQRGRSREMRYNDLLPVQENRLTLIGNKKLTSTYPLLNTKLIDKVHNSQLLPIRIAFDMNPPYFNVLRAASNFVGAETPQTCFGRAYAR